MTPAGHIAEAERLLDGLADLWAAGGSERALQDAVAATGHALIAVAVELGAPHPAAPAGGEGSAQTAPPG